MNAGVRGTLLVLAGATGVGKTRAAIELCRTIDGEIVGADSVQVYRGFDIGSGKPSAEELGTVRHHLLDVLEPDEPIDAAEFARRADRAIEEVTARGRVPVVVGGTGLWLRALLRGLLQLPPVDAALRAQLEAEFRERGADEMHARLRAIDPRAAQAIHASDMLRVVRALEVHAQTGAPLGELRAAHALGAPRYRALTLCLDLEKPLWRERVAARIAAMFEAGWVPEVQALVERYGPAIKPLRSVGYRQIAEGLARGEEREEIERRVLQATLVYGRRQRNWFRSDPSVDRWLDAGALLAKQNLAQIREHLGAT